METKNSFFKISSKFVFKRHGEDFYFIDITDSLNNRFIVGKGAEKVLFPLLKGKSKEEVALSVGVDEKLIEEYASLLIKKKILKASSCSVNSSNHCFKIFPSIDTLDVMITNKCNLSCPHCFPDSGKIHYDEVDVEVWIDVFKQAKKLGIFGLNISGGEPFLSKKLYEILEYLRSENYFQVNLNTNGTIPIDSYLKIISKTISLVQVSLDGNTKNHDFFRGQKGSFDKAVCTIKKLMSYGIEVGVAFSLGANNLNQLDEVVSVCKDLGVKHLSIGFIKSVGRSLCNNLAINSISLSKDKFIDKMLNKFLILQRLKGLEISFPFDFSGEKNELITPESLICGGNIIQSMAITPNGDTTPCGMLLSEEFFCGNIKDYKIEDIWLSEKMQNFRMFPLKKVPGCCDCDKIQYCGKPCLVQMFSTNNNLELPDTGRCLITEKIISLINK